MSPLDPSMMAGPLQQAPADRPTMNLEQALQAVIAIIFGDNKMDENEMAMFRNFLDEVSQRAQMAGGIGLGSAPQPGMEDQQSMSPMEMNQNTQDYGTAEGAAPENQEEAA